MVIYRAEIADKHEIDKHLHISSTELRRLNRWYFKHRLKPYLSSHSFFNRTMKKKTDACYLKALKKWLLEAGKENKFLRLKAEAFEIAIQIAEEEFKIPILKKSGTVQPKKICFGNVEYPANYAKTG